MSRRDFDAGRKFSSLESELRRMANIISKPASQRTTLEDMYLEKLDAKFGEYTALAKKYGVEAKDTAHISAIYERARKHV